MAGGGRILVYDGLEEGVFLSSGMGASSREVGIPAPDVSESCTCIMSLR